MNILIFLLIIACAHAKYCSNHDGCSGDSISDSSLTCNGGERCCKDTKFTCTANSCTVTIKGGGHDQFRGGVIYAMDATALHLKCQATGQRKCKNAKIFCPMAGNCICDGCPSNAKMYCPTGVLCTGGGATVINMDKYICKGTGSNMYCPDIDESIETCGTQEECTSLIWGVNYLSMSCKNSTGHYNRPRCPYYYQNRYDNIIYNYVNVTVTHYEDAAKPLVDLCKDSIPPSNKLIKSRNRAFQIKSWNVGCEKRKDTLDKCKKACNNGCCGSTCASNSCSGGGCCAASKNICIEACKWIWSPQVYNITQYINVTNETRIINKTRWINKTHIIYSNKTRWINKTHNITIFNNITRWINKTHNITIINNKTRWINKTQNVTRYINMTRWFNKTRNVTRYVNKTRWFNKTRNVTRYINMTRWFNKTRNVTRYINMTRWFNKTTNITRYVNKTRWFNKTTNITRYVNKTRWHNKTRWINKTKEIIKIINKTVIINSTVNVTRYVTKIRWINKTENVPAPNGTSAYKPSIIPKPLENSTETEKEQLTTSEYVIYGSCAVIGFMGGCFFSYGLYRFKQYIDGFLDCCDIIGAAAPSPEPSPVRKRKKKIEITVQNPRVETLRKRSNSNSPKHKRVLI